MHLSRVAFDFPLLNERLRIRILEQLLDNSGPMTSQTRVLTLPGSPPQHLSDFLPFQNLSRRTWITSSISCSPACRATSNSSVSACRSSPTSAWTTPGGAPTSNWRPWSSRKWSSPTGGLSSQPSSGALLSSTICDPGSFEMRRYYSGAALLPKLGLTSADRKDVWQRLL